MLFDCVLQSSFSVIPNITPANSCKPIHDINYSISICLFESGNCGKEEQKLQNLGNEKSFLDEIKTFFIVFQGLSLGEKIKI